MPEKSMDINRMAELAESSGSIGEDDKMAHENLSSAQGLLLKGEQAVCTSDNSRNLNGIEDKQPRLIDISHDNHRGGTCMDMIANEADTPSTADNAEMISIKLEEVTNKF
ncbi:hypothetical protein EDC04DRAFT_2607980 [Pisolithus marmoratus]|nr:hypothetical protein EDC04DRAFT_2607980 [Pisolithus marmoratus]